MSGYSIDITGIRSPYINFGKNFNNKVSQVVWNPDRMIAKAGASGLIN
tara:strand:+ start:42104 stop:42247 length:144 start_codon:yes stop_codon:yes gene_type:complete